MDNRGCSSWKDDGIPSLKSLFVCFILLAFSVLLYGCEEINGSFGKKAYEACGRICEIGPRVSGSENLEKVREMICFSLEKSSLKPERDVFSSETPLGKVSFVNISALKKGKSGKRIIVAAHYESKFFKDFEFVGANDNASGTAVLMGIASEFKDRRFNHDLEFLFLDGEEAFEKWSSSDSLYGSRRRASLIGRPENIKAFILIDMIGKKNLKINYEGCSDPSLSALLEDAAEETGLSDSLSGQLVFVEDDHIPFAGLGIPSIDIIDFSFPEWHTEKDNMECISADSLEKAGTIIMRLIEKIDSGK